MDIPRPAPEPAPPLLLWRIAAGAGAWIALAAVFTISMGWRRHAAGLPLLESWYDAAHHFAILTFGGILTPIVVLAIRRLRSEPRSPARIVGGYAVIGLGFWLGWALLRVGYMRAMYPAAAADLPLFDHVARALVFTALVALTVYVAIVLMYEGAWHRREARKRELEAARLQLDLEEARAAAVRARIDPQFLGDAFATAETLVAQDPGAARTLLADLSEVLRVALGRLGTSTIPLKRELDLARLVADIHQAGSSAPVGLEFDIDRGSRDQGVYPLVLQPALNEAFRWLRDSGATADSSLRIEARTDGAELVISLTINRGAATDAVSPWDRGPEIRAVKDRLRRRYGAQASVAAISAPTGGEYDWRVVLRLVSPAARRPALPTPSRPFHAPSTSCFVSAPSVREAWGQLLGRRPFV